MKRVAVVALAVAMAAPAAFAAESGILQEIEVKAKREARTETLEVREVREGSAADLGEAAEAVPGVTKIRKGGIANDVVIRGFQRDNINVTIDGVQLHGACPNRMDPPSFHLDYAEVDRVEVKKGPYDVAHPGSMGGIVDVRTRAVPPGGHGEVNLGYGSFGAREGSAVLSWGGEKAGILGGYAWKGASPYETGDGRRITELTYLRADGTVNPGPHYRPDDRDDPAYGIRTAWLRGVLRPGPDALLDVSYARQEAEDVLYPYLLMDAGYDDSDRLNAELTLKNLGPLSTARLQAYWNSVEHDMDDSRRCSSTANAAACLAGAPPVPLARAYSMRTFARSKVGGGKAEALLPGGGGETTLGADYSARWWDAVTTRGAGYPDNASIPDVVVHNLGLYAEHRRPLSPALRLTGGVRLDRARSAPGVDRSAFYAIYHGTGLDLNRTDTALSGNLQVDYDLAQGLSLYLGYGHGVRLPDPQERYFALPRTSPSTTGTTGNPRLEPVKNDEGDVGVKYSRGGVSAKGQLFYSDLSDFIVVANVTGSDNSSAKTYRNVDATMYGAEGVARVALPLDLFASASATWTRGKNDTDGRDLAEVPPFRGAVALRYDVDRWFAEAEELFAARQGKVDPSVRETATAGWAVTNLKAGVRYAGLRLLAGVRNVFDKDYTEHLSYLRDPFSAGVKVPEPGRSFYTNVQYAF